MEILYKLETFGIAFVDLNIPYQTDPVLGKIIYSLLVWLAEFEVVNKKQRQKIGIEKAQALGKYANRKKSNLMNEVLEENEFFI
jgi:DNA invertase Pin-like site-specific DNA recombinase